MTDIDDHEKSMQPTQQMHHMHVARQTWLPGAGGNVWAATGRELGCGESHDHTSSTMHHATYWQKLATVSLQSGVLVVAVASTVVRKVAAEVPPPHMPQDLLHLSMIVAAGKLRLNRVGWLHKLGGNALPGMYFGVNPAMLATCQQNPASSSAQWPAASVVVTAAVLGACAGRVVVATVGAVVAQRAQYFWHRAWINCAEYGRPCRSGSSHRPG